MEGISMRFWDLLREADRQKLRSLMPKRWRPPSDDAPAVSVDYAVPTFEELDRIMRQVPVPPAPPDKPKRRRVAAKA